MSTNPFGRMRENLAYDWTSQARDNQRLPEGDWLYWLILAGRGFGKTRTVSETVRQWIKDGFNYVNLIGATAHYIRTIMVEGPAGILSCCPNSERPEYLKRSYELRWPNGATSLLFSAEEPDRLRGKQHMKLAADEIAAWREPDAWDQALLGLRLGRKPQAVVATTPRPTKIIEGLVADPKTHLTKGSTFDNRANLSDAFIHQIVQRFHGPRQGRQELMAEILEDTPGALWNRAGLEASRLPATAAQWDFKRIVVAIDPAVSVGEDSDETGIVVAGIDHRDHLCILEDLSGRHQPHQFASIAIAAFKRWRGDRIVAEINNGGAMVEATLRAVDHTIPFRGVHASRGKAVRAEPVSSLWETGRAHLIGSLPELEDQMCGFSPNMPGGSAGSSPDRVDAMVWAGTELALNGQRPQFVFA
jgi:phage terminase large subunit-like protein